MNSRVEALLKVKRMFNKGAKDIFERLNPEEQNELLKKFEEIDKETGISKEDEVPESILKTFRKKQNEQPF